MPAGYGEAAPNGDRDIAPSEMLILRRHAVLLPHVRPVVAAALVALLAAPAAAWPGSAQAAGWRLEEPAARWAVSDGERWAAWAVSSEVVVAFDTLADKRREIELDRPCAPDGGADRRLAAAGRVLLRCERDGVTRQVLLNLRTGALRTLPDRMREPFDLPGIRWTDVGRRWVSGEVDCPNGPCGMWLELSSGRLVTGILQPPRDLDEPNLPRLGACRRVAAGTPAPGIAFFRGALLSVRSVGGRFRLERRTCRKDPVPLAVESGRPRSRQLSFGLASWTTTVPEARADAAATHRSAQMTVVDEDGRARARWRLPARTVVDCDDRPAPAAWGVTAHTRRRALFFQTMRQARDGEGCAIRSLRVLSRPLPRALRR
jgi:hypothetical protein